MSVQDYGLRLPAEGDTCGALSNQGSVCAREPDHGGCHEVYVDGDGRRWYGDARWAPWIWIVYAERCRRAR